MASVGCRCDAACIDSGNCCHDFKEQCPAEFAKGIFDHSYYFNVTHNLKVI